MTDVLNQVKAVLTTTATHWLNLTKTLPDDLLNRQPATGEWSATGCLIHLLDTEYIFPARVRALLAGDFELRFEQGVATYLDRDGAAAWDAFVTGYGPTKALAKSLDDSRRVELKEAFIALHESYRTELGIAVPREYLITLGKRK